MTHDEERNYITNQESDLPAPEMKDPLHDEEGWHQNENVPDAGICDLQREEGIIRSTAKRALEEERLQIRRYLRTTNTLENTERPSHINAAAWEAYFPDELRLHVWNGKKYWRTTLQDIGEVVESPSRRLFERNLKALDDVRVRIGDPDQHLLKEQSEMLNNDSEFSNHAWNDFRADDPQEEPPAANRGLSSLCSSDTGGFTSAAPTGQITSDLNIDSNISNPVNEVEDTDEAFADCLLRMPLPFDGKKVKTGLFYFVLLLTNANSIIV